MTPREASATTGQGERLPQRHQYVRHSCLWVKHRPEKWCSVNNHSRRWPCTTFRRRALTHKAASLTHVNVTQGQLFFILCRLCLPYGHFLSFAVALASVQLQFTCVERLLKWGRATLVMSLSAVNDRLAMYILNGDNSRSLKNMVQDQRLPSGCRRV